MRDYDIEDPVIAIHIPKCGGRSAEEIYKGWFGDGFLPHYYHEINQTMPEKYEISTLHSRDRPVLVYGHFNKNRQFGVEDYYPEVQQFITILRDPFELSVSSYFYINKNSDDWGGNTPVSGLNVVEFLSRIKRVQMLNHFPREITLNNYRDILDEYFIEVGVTEYLDESMGRIAIKLGMPYTLNTILHRNATAREEDVPEELRGMFRDKFKLEYAVYDYILSRYA